MDGETVEKRIMLDRISDLPNSVIDIILSCVPLRVAVRTSILSRKWRLHWTRLENLVFDLDFNDDIVSMCYGQEDEVKASTYMGIVGNILLSHSGPIRKFHLRVLYVGEDISDAINLWILAVSRHGVQDLTLDYYDAGYDYKMPSYVFQCTELKHLSLVNVEIPPQNFETLSSLLSLSLSLSFDCNVISGDIKCPDMLDFFGGVPKLENFNLTGLVLDEWGVQDVPKMLPAPLENHLHLTVDYWNMYSLAQVRSMLCLINSSPKVQTLAIFARSESDSPSDVTSDYLKSLLKEAENLWSLKTVKIRGLNGIEPELHFIKLILSCCPMLEELYLTSLYITVDAEFKMMADIMRFRRASVQAEIIYSKFRHS